MEFPMETTNGSFGDVAEENLKPEESGEVQYVYDNSEFIMGETVDYNNITDLVLEDGTRAMIVNGTLVTADGQTVILQDGSDLSQYSVDDNADEILISKEQEDQFLQIMNPHDNQNDDANVIHYVQDDSGDITMKQDCDQQILYIQDGENILPIQEQYQIAELDSENSKEAMEVLKFNNEQMLEEVEGVIDLEQLLISQQGAIQLENGNYQYAILKDGKFHLQVANSAVDILGSHNIANHDDSIILSESGMLNSSDYLDLSAIKGRNIKTGQVITLSRHMDKSLNKKLKSEIKNKVEERHKTNVAPSSNNLRKLINKKITIGQTDKGKMLVGKIVNVMKKADVNIKNKFTNSSSRTIKKAVSTPSSRRLKEISKTAANDVINLISDEEGSLFENINNKSGNNDMLIQTTTISTPSSLSIVSPDGHQVNTSISKPILSKISLAEDNLVKKEIPKHENEEPTKDNPKITNSENSAEHSKIIVHKKVVTKDCFEVITRTLTGLMNMDSVVKKLKNRTIIIKIIEKTYNQDKKDYTKTISYCSGYMVREYKLDDHDSSFSESWRFIPDTNSKETILGQNNLETLMQDGVSGRGLKKFANLTIQITVSPEGNRTTRVIINPPALFQCKACSKSFRTSALLKIHSMDCHTPLGLECGDCSLKFKTIAETKDHSLSFHPSESNKGMYECMECNQCFQTPSQIRKHMDMHYTPSVCPVCKLSLPNVKDLNKHILTHFNSHPPHQLSDTDHTEQEDGNDKLTSRKVFSCHICTRQFSRHSNLQRHIEIHQGEGAMYQCAVCSCSYHYISSLTRHVVSCHVDKAKKLRSNVNDSQTNSQDINSENKDQEFQFLQDDQIVQMIPLENMTEESLQQYVNQNMEYVAQDFEGTGDEVQILQIPMDSNVVIED